MKNGNSAPSAWKTIEKSGDWREILNRYGAAAAQPDVAMPSIFKRDQRFTFLHDSSHFSNDGSIVLFAACEGYISNIQIN